MRARFEASAHNETWNENTLATSTRHFVCIASLHSRRTVASRHRDLHLFGRNMQLEQLGMGGGGSGSGDH